MFIDLICYNGHYYTVIMMTDNTKDRGTEMSARQQKDADCIPPSSLEAQKLSDKQAHTLGRKQCNNAHLEIYEKGKMLTVCIVQDKESPKPHGHVLLMRNNSLQPDAPDHYEHFHTRNRHQRGAVSPAL